MMAMKFWQRTMLSGLIILSCASTALARPKVFSEFTYEQAKQQAQKDHKFLIIDFMATWCSPCKKMEKTSWRDDAVQAWIQENAIAIQVDVDKDEKTSEAFKITGMPTVVMFSPENSTKEFSRQDGFLSASELMQWFQGAKSGKSAVQLDKELSGANQNEIWEHVSKARELQTAGKNSEALTEYVWLWNNVPKDDPNLGDMRVSLVPSEMKKLAAAYPEAKVKFAELRDAADKANNRHDWILLNGILDQNPATLAWFDKAKSDASQKDNFRKLTTLLEPILFSNMRWADAATFLYPDPMQRVAEYFKKAQDMKKPRPDTEFAKDFDPFPSMVMLLYGAYVGANREAEAQKIFDECVRLDDTQGMRDALNNMAKGMRQARASVQGK